MGNFSDFIWYFLMYLLSPFFWIMILILVAWICFIVHLKKKYGESSRLLFNLIGTIVGILIVIAYPLGCTIFSGPVRFM